jgi:peptide/nickel transport system permease protein
MARRLSCRYGSAVRRIAMGIARRVLMLFLLLALVFAAVQLLPGDAATATAERGSNAEEVAVVRTRLGLDRPLPERFLHWLSDLLTGGLGTSARGEHVNQLLSSPFANTVLLGVLALVSTVTLSLILGCWAALRQGGVPDRIVSTAATVALALPEFVIAAALVLVLALWTGWLPAVTVANERGAPTSWSMLVLPVLALAIPQIGWNTRIVRAALADEAKAAYVEMAVLDGLTRRRILSHHLLPGALPAIAAGAATSTGMFFGGAVVVETVFNYPGVGAVLAGAVADRDTPVIAAIVALTTALITVALLVSDLVRVRASIARARP